MESVLEHQSKLPTPTDLRVDRRAFVRTQVGAKAFGDSYAARLDQFGDSLAPKETRFYRVRPDIACDLEGGGARLGHRKPIVRVRFGFSAFEKLLFDVVLRRFEHLNE